MQDPVFSEHLFTSENQTATFAARLAQHLRPGDCVLMEGPVGAGKSFFARAAILSLLEEPEDIPSPTFTLVQTYDSPTGEIWHSDLYRLSHPDEIEELGLNDAMTDAICFIEWPDRLGSYRPENALTLVFENGQQADERHLTMRAQDARWAKLISGVYDDAN